MRKFIKSDEVKNCEKRESRENDFITKKKQEIKKLLSQITNLHNDVIRIIKNPPDCINCFNALEDGFKYHCSYLFYCTRLTCCQEKLFGYVNEIQEEVLSIRTDLAKLQSECNAYAYKLFLQYNPNYHRKRTKFKQLTKRNCRPNFRKIQQHFKTFEKKHFNISRPTISFTSFISLHHSI